MIVGVLGGIGAGKSTVTGMLVDLGAEAVDADRLAHEALESPPVRAELVRWLGKEVLGPGGRVDRNVLARRVFSNPGDLRRLEGLVHPVVLGEIKAKVKDHRRKGKEAGMLVLDVPLLASTALLDECDAILFVDAARDVRRRRVEERGWAAGELERRERLQPSIEEKKRRSDHVIDNSSSLEDTRRQVVRVRDRLLEGGAES